MHNHQWITVLTNTGTVIVGGDAAPPPAPPAEAAPATATGTPAPPPAEDYGFLGPGGWTTLAMYALLPVALYFLMIRPQRKREKEMRAMQQSIGVGDSVIISNGMYGVVSGIGDDCFVIEFGTNKGVKIPVRKTDVLGIKAPQINPSAPKEIAE